VPPLRHRIAALAFVAATLVTVAEAAPQSTLDRPFREAGETIETDRTRELDILETALRFYRPFGAQSRWLDRERLPDARGASPVPLSSEAMNVLVERLGRGKFCASDAREACRFRQGGRVRISAAYLTDPDHARVVVEFESVWPYGPSIVTSQVIWLVHDKRGWRIERRADPA